MKKIMLVAFLSISVFAQAQWFTFKGIRDNGNITEEVRKVTAFTNIESRGSLDVILSNENPYSIRITASENIIPYIVTEVENSTLIIKLKDNQNYSFKHKVEIVVGVKVLEKLKLIGSGDVEGSGLSGNSLQCELVGSGDVELRDLQMNRIDIKIKGSGDIFVSGKAQTVDGLVNGSGDLDTTRLVADEVSVRVQGSGDAEVFAKNKITAKVSGSGDIIIRGNPKIKSTSVSGSGDIRFK